MLEQAGVRLVPVTERVWNILALDDPDEVLGSARWIPDDATSWTFWRRRHLEVREHIDEPLVFTVRRRWSWQPEYDVYDAEEEYVGCITTGKIALRGIRRAEQHSTNEAELFRNDEDGVIARWAGEQLEFTAAVKDDPFFKMLLLACVLVRLSES